MIVGLLVIVDAVLYELDVVEIVIAFSSQGVDF